MVLGPGAGARPTRWIVTHERPVCAWRASLVSESTWWTVEAEVPDACSGRDWKEIGSTTLDGRDYDSRYLLVECEGQTTQACRVCRLVFPFSARQHLVWDEKDASTSPQDDDGQVEFVFRQAPSTRASTIFASDDLQASNVWLSRTLYDHAFAAITAISLSIPMTEFS